MMKTMIEAPEKVNRVELEARVKKMYREVALKPEVTYHFEMGRKLAERLGYPADLLNGIPGEAIDSFAGVGYFFDMASLKAGEKVADLGSGSGMDVFFAAGQVGHEGQVIGLDMTPEQLYKGNRLKNQFGYRQVEFKKSNIEALPLNDESLDAVISNGVINLSASKAQVFKEAARVLKPGGRLALADIVSDKTLPPSISTNATLWAACIGGAMQKEDYLAIIEEAGLKIVKVRENPYAFISESAKGATRDYGIKSISILAVKA